MNKIVKYKGVIIGVVLGVILGILGMQFVGHHHDGAEGNAENETTMYTCSMDPSVKQDHPGKCPICGMDLIPMGKSGGATASHSSDPNAVEMTDEAVALANIETEVVGAGNTSKEVRLFGKIQPDERLQQTQAAYVGGRIEKLLINAVGDVVSKGQTLAVIYSPELYATSQELVAALNYPASPQKQALVDAAIEKLKLLNVTQAQINQVIKTKKASPYAQLKANTSGTVVAKNVNQGDYVNQGAPILKIANLSTVWAVFQAYEGDLPFVKKGATIQFTSEAMPGKVFKGVVSFIDPMLNGSTRTAGVRVVMSNPGGMFKPEMIVTGHAAAKMSQYAEDIVVPKSAVLWTGKRSVVYVKEEDTAMPTFSLRQVTLGPSLADSYVIVDGLAEGEEIVTNGAFAIDASAQLAGKKSMMDQE